MTNPWLTIPAADYEGHMGAPEVEQLQTLNRLTASILRTSRPRSLAVYGCATGNGFEHIDPARTRRIVGVDLNPAYLQVLHARFAARLPALELLAQDLAAQDFVIAPVELAIAALIFEYVAPVRATAHIARSLAPDGLLVAVLQLPSARSAPVTPTAYASLQALGPIMALVPPERFTQTCAAMGLTLEQSQIIPLKQGKRFFVGYYRKFAAPKPRAAEAKP